MKATNARRLFEGHRQLRAVVEGVLEGGQGAVVDRGEAARLSLGCYELFAGDPDSPGARELVASAARPRELIYGNDPAWRRLLLEVHRTAVADRPMREFDPSELSRDRLARLSAAVPPGIRIERLDGALAGQLDAELEPHGLQVFPSPEDLVSSGLGFGAVHEGRLVSAATSYACSPRLVEVAIATRPAFRGRGLATAVAGGLLGYCLDKGLSPRWSAANPVSQRLAARLGFRPGETCEVLYLA